MQERVGPASWPATRTAIEVFAYLSCWNLYEFQTVERLVRMAARGRTSAHYFRYQVQGLE